MKTLRKKKKTFKEKYGSLRQAGNGHKTNYQQLSETNKPGNTKGGSITLPLTSCLTGLD